MELSGVVIVFLCAFTCHAQSNLEDRDFVDYFDEEAARTSWMDALPYLKTHAVTEPECGVVHARKKTCAQGYCSIREARRQHHPWHAAVFRGNNREYLCSGVLVRRDWVVTTATCALNAPSDHLWVHLGEINIRGDGRDEHGTVWETPVAAVVDHPHFNEYYMQYDVAALRLEDPVDYQKFSSIRPICLPQSEQDFSELDCYTVGWHMSPVKEVKETVLHDAGVHSPLDMLPYTGQDGYVVTDDMGRVARRSYRQPLLEAALKITSQRTCRDMAKMRGDAFLTDGLKQGHGCLVGQEPGNACTPDVGSAVSCMSSKDSARRRRAAEENSVQWIQERQDVESVRAMAGERDSSGFRPCTPYPQLRTEQLKENRGPVKARTSAKFYLAGIVSYVGHCNREVNGGRPELAVFTDFKVISSFLKHIF